MPDQYLHRLAALSSAPAATNDAAFDEVAGASPTPSPVAAWCTSTARATPCCRARRRSPATAAMSVSTR